MKNTTSGLDQFPRLIGRCVVCDDGNRARAAQGLRTERTPVGLSQWACLDCADLMARQPGIVATVEMCATIGVPYLKIARLFARLGVEPPTDAAGVHDAMERIARGASA